MARQSRIDTVILNIPMAEDERLLHTLSRVGELPVDIRMPASASRVRFQPRTYSYIGDVAFIDLSDRPISDWGSVVKWTVRQGHRIRCGPAACTGDGRGRDRDQARQPWPGAVPPAALRLQQRTHRGVQVPLDVVSRCDANASKLVTRTTRASPPSDASSARRARRTAAAVQRAAR